MSPATTFGTELRAARQRAGFNTISRLADALSQRELPYGDDTLNKWELDQRRPTRETALLVLAVLVKHGGLTSLAAVNNLLWLLGLRDLDSLEIARFFAGLPVRVAHSNLPPPPPFTRLIGRDERLNRLYDHLENPASTPVVVISGLGGIGKTALAWEVTNRIMNAGTFNALAWESAKSEEFTGVNRQPRRGAPLNLHSVLVSFAQQLAIDLPEKITADDLLYRLRHHLRQKPCLLVLDNLETLESARDSARLLHDLVSPSAAERPSKVLLTSRQSLAEESFVYDERLTGLNHDHTVEMLQSEASTRQAEALLSLSPFLLDRIHQVTGGMPLAIKLIVSQFLLGIALDTELERLGRAADEEELYRFIYFALWGKLSIPAQQIMVGAAAFSTSAMRHMLIEVSELAQPPFDLAIAELVRMCLIEVLPHAEERRQRYDLHAMTRWFINSPLAERWEEQKRVSPG